MNQPDLHDLPTPTARVTMNEPTTQAGRDWLRRIAPQPHECPVSDSGEHETYGGLCHCGWSRNNPQKAGHARRPTGEESRDAILAIEAEAAHAATLVERSGTTERADGLAKALKAMTPAYPWEREPPGEGLVTTDEPWYCGWCFATVPYNRERYEQPKATEGHNPGCDWLAARAALAAHRPVIEAQAAHAATERAEGLRDTLKIIHGYVETVELVDADLIAEWCIAALAPVPPQEEP